MADPSILAPAALARLRQIGGEELIRKLAGIFMEQVPRHIDAAREAERAGDLPAVERAGHSVKSTAWNLGSAALGGIAEELEHAAGRGKAENLGELLKRMESAFAAVRDELLRQVPGLEGRKTVAVIEDNADNRVLVGAILEGVYETRGYSNGPEALAGMKSDPPALVLLDVSLPVMDGQEVLARIRRDPKLKGIPVIALTAHTMAGDREHFLGAGFDDYLAKPIVDPQHLIGAIRRLLDAAGKAGRG